MKIDVKIDIINYCSSLLAIMSSHNLKTVSQAGLSSVSCKAGGCFSIHEKTKVSIRLIKSIKL